MFKESLETIGLSHDEAEIYEILLIGGASGAGFILEKTKIKRGLLYKVLTRLIKRGLVYEKTVRGRAVFSAAPPDELYKAAEIAEQEALRIKKTISESLPEMKAKYNLSHERPTIRFFEGVDGLKKLYEEKLLPSASKEFRFIRPLQARVYQDIFGKWFGYFLNKRAELGIKTFAITPDDHDSNHDPKKDLSRGVSRTWIRPEDYTSQVEINTHGDRTEIISYGKEIFAFTIDDGFIAKAIKDILILADKGAKTILVNHNHK